MKCNVNLFHLLPWQETFGEGGEGAKYDNNEYVSVAVMTEITFCYNDNVIVNKILKIRC